MYRMKKKTNKQTNKQIRNQFLTVYTPYTVALYRGRTMFNIERFTQGNLDPGKCV